VRPRSYCARREFGRRLLRRRCFFCGVAVLLRITADRRSNDLCGNGDVFDERPVLDVALHEQQRVGRAFAAADQAEADRLQDVVDAPCVLHEAHHDLRRAGVALVLQLAELFDPQPELVLAVSPEQRGRTVGAHASAGVQVTGPSDCIVRAWLILASS